MTDEWLEKFEQAHAERETAERTLTLLGEQLTVKASVAPEVALRLTAMRRAVSEDLDNLRAAEVALQAAKEAAVAAGVDPEAIDQALPRLTITDQEMLEIGEVTVLACLEDGSHEAWRRLRDPARANPLRFSEIFSICDYLIGRASATPTGGPADSPNGPTPTEVSSTDASSSPAAESEA